MAEPLGISPDYSRRLARMLRWFEQRGGDGQRTARGPAPTGRGPALWFWARITGYAEADAPAQNRWVYSWVEVGKGAAGYGGWESVTGGRSGTTSTDPARNFMEDGNDGAGVEMNGVDLGNLPGSFAIQPVPAGAIVRMEIVPVDGSVEFWFNPGGNGVDGSC